MLFNEECDQNNPQIYVIFQYENNIFKTLTVFIFWFIDVYT